MYDPLAEIFVFSSLRTLTIVRAIVLRFDDRAGDLCLRTLTIVRAIVLHYYESVSEYTVLEPSQL